MQCVSTSGATPPANPARARPTQVPGSAARQETLAAATIAQVHEATLQGGRHVAAKVQRPCLQAMIATDIPTLTYPVALGEKLVPRLRALDLPVVVSEFAESLL
jgi:ubiquinone biosynthesis protein